MKFTFSKKSIAGSIILIIGFFLTIQGIIIRYNLTHINGSYGKYEIKNGRYIEYDITKEYLMGKYYSEPNGKINYGPYHGSDVVTSIDTYVVAVNENLDYYVPLIVVEKYQKAFEETYYNDKTYHIFGKFQKFKGELLYDIIYKCIGLSKKSEIDKLISDNYEIKIVDIKNEKMALYKGISILIVGLLILYDCYRENERRDLDD